MRLVFAGTPEFAESALRALSQTDHTLLGVLTQPDRASGRGLSQTESPVKKTARALNLPLMQPISLRPGRPGAQEAMDWLRALAPDLMIVAAYGLILPKNVLEIPRLGCLNIHASLLPRWRGAAPIQRAIAAGDRETGISLMQMDEGLDTGPVWKTEAIPISADDNFQTVHDRLAGLGGQLLVSLLESFPPEGLLPQPQDAALASYAKKIEKEDQYIDWTQTTHQIAHQIQSLDPSPGAVTQFKDEAIKLFQAGVVSPEARGRPGEVIQADRHGLFVACGQGTLSIGALQRPGGKRLSFREFLNGRTVAAGDQFA